MSRKESYKSFLKWILLEFRNDVENFNDMNDMLEQAGISETYGNIEISENSIVKKLFALSKNCYEQEENLDMEIHDVEYKCIKAQFDASQKKRAFLYISENVISYSKFNEDLTPSIWNAILIVCAKDYAEMNDILRYLIHTDDNHYVIIYKPAILRADIKPYEVFSYALAAFHNEKGILPIKDKLIWSNNDLNVGLSFKDTIKYEQYHDFYDAINDWLSAKDVLTAFKCMYQVLEYMVYRHLLVELVDSTDKKQSFLRNIKNLNNKFEQNERQTMIDGITSLLPSFVKHDATGPVATITEIDANVESFVSKYWPNKDGQTYLRSADTTDDRINKAIAKFIYDTRCAIVHNKEAELHFTLNNYEDYKDIVKLMNQVIKLVWGKVFEVMNDNSKKLLFDKPSLQLY